jgi:hypothetical protein
VSDPAVVTDPPVTTVDEAIGRMQAIGAALPSSDGVGIFNGIYLQVTELIRDKIQTGFYADPAFMTHFDVVFVNFYLDALRAAAGSPDQLARCWAPLIERRGDGHVEPIQFAFAGLNAHMNHDLAVAVVNTCADLHTAPGDGSHHDDYCRVNDLLASLETSIRQSFEDAAARAVDTRFQAALNLVCNWSIVEARTAAWTNAEALWELRRVPRLARDYASALDGTVGMASRALLVALP